MLAVVIVFMVAAAASADPPLRSAPQVLHRHDVRMLIDVRKSNTESCIALIDGTALGDRINEDFRPWENRKGTPTKRTFCATKKKECFSISIRDGVPYVVRAYFGFQTRLQATLKMISGVADRHNLPNADFDVDFSDGIDSEDVNEPVMFISKRKSKQGPILYPDFTFSDWPESRCPAEYLQDDASQSRAWEHVFAELEKTSKMTNWSERQDDLFWRGNDNLAGRQPSLADLSKTVSSIALDFDETAVGSSSAEKSRNCVQLRDWCKHKYLLHLPGITYSSSLKYKMLCGSAVVVVDRTDPFIEYWHNVLQDEKNVIRWDGRWRETQLRAMSADEASITAEGTDLSLGRSKEAPLPAMIADEASTTAMAYAPSPLFPERAHDIALRAFQDTERYLSPEMVACYWVKLAESMHAFVPIAETADSAIPGVALTEYLEKQMWRQPYSAE